MLCPNCRKEIEDHVECCPYCGNPFGKERPWELKNKKPSEEKKNREKGSGPKVRHQIIRNTKQARYDATMQQEWYLKDEFVIHVGYCGFTENPENPDQLREGTAILTKNLLLFGNSEHSIRCGKFVFEIPVKVIRCVTDAEFKGKPAFLIEVDSGEKFIMYVMKKSKWIEYFNLVTKYIPAEIDPVAKKQEERSSVSFIERWGKALIYLIGVIVFSVWSFFEDGLFHYVFIFIAICCLFLVGISIFAPEKLKR